MKQPTLLIPLTRTGSSPTLGEQRHADCPNTGKAFVKHHADCPYAENHAPSLAEQTSGAVPLR